MAVAVEIEHSGSAASWHVGTGAELASPSTPNTFFESAVSGVALTVRVRPTSGWRFGTSIALAFVVGVRDDSDKRAIFVQSSIANQVRTLTPALHARAFRSTPPA